MTSIASKVGERGQAVIPKPLREKYGIKKNDRVLFKEENEKIVVEKVLSKKQKEALMKEYYTKYGKMLEEMAEEWMPASAEANRLLDE